jgi:tetratricopeptide (TPR) repeat protein
VAATVPLHSVPPDAGQAEVGGVLGDRYELLAELGRGAEGVVFRARDRKADTIVALKLLGASGARLDRFRRELQLARMVTHPGVVRIYDLVEIAGGFALSMELVDGESLETRLAREPPLTAAEVTELARDLAGSLAAAHAAGVTHRDLKPANILLRAGTKRAVVTDFGVSRLSEALSVPASSGASPAAPHLTREGALVGTPLYMAPEQLRGSTRVGPSADVYAFGLIVFESATRTRPHVGNSVAELLALRDAATTPKLARVRPDLDPRLCAAVDRCLSPDKAARFEDGRALSQALAPRESLWKRAWPSLAIAVALIAASAAVIVRSRAAPNPCASGAALAAEAWGPEASARLRTAFLATSVPYAEAAFASFARQLDEYAAAWGKMHDEACAATRLRGEQSDEVLELRMRCLSGRRDELRALVSVASHPDADEVKEASAAPRQLAAVAECADVVLLRSFSSRPRDPALRAKVDDLTARTAQMKAEWALGKATDAAKLADEILPEANKAGWEPVIGELQLYRATAYASKNESDKSIPGFHAAFDSALRGGGDWLLREAAVDLAQEYMYADDLKEFAYWADITQAALTRGEPNARQIDFLATLRCVAMDGHTRPSERLGCFRAFADRVTKTRAMTDWELSNLGLAEATAGDTSHALEHVRASFDTAAKEFGANHPRALIMRVWVCRALYNQGDLDAALTECQAILEACQKEAPDNAYLAAQVSWPLGDVLEALGRYAEARVAYQRAKDGDDPDGVEVALHVLEIDEGRASVAVAPLQGIVDRLAKKGPSATLDRARYALGRAERVMGRLPEARAVLEELVASDVAGEVAPAPLAMAKFELARALWDGAGGDRARAEALAREAREVLARGAPSTKRYEDELGRMDRWIAGMR